MPSAEFHSEPAIWQGDASNEMLPIIATNGQALPGSCKACMTPKNVPGPCDPMPDVPYVTVDISAASWDAGLSGSTSVEDRSEPAGQPLWQLTQVDGSYQFTSQSAGVMYLSPSFNCGTSQCIWEGWIGDYWVGDRLYRASDPNAVYDVRASGFQTTYADRNFEIENSNRFEGVTFPADQILRRDCSSGLALYEQMTAFEGSGAQTYIDRDGTVVTLTDSLSRTVDYDLIFQRNGWFGTFEVDGLNFRLRLQVRAHEFEIIDFYKSDITSASNVNLNPNYVWQTSEASSNLSNNRVTSSAWDPQYTGDMANVALYGGSFADYTIPIADVDNAFRGEGETLTLAAYSNPSLTDLWTPPASLVIKNPFGFPINA